jgi:hypothetical protein
VRRPAGGGQGRRGQSRRGATRGRKKLRKVKVLAVRKELPRGRSRGRLAEGGRAIVLSRDGSRDRAILHLWHRKQAHFYNTPIIKRRVVSQDHIE